MKTPISFVLLGIGLLANALAAERATNAPISFVVPGAGSSTIERAQFLILVVESSFVSYENTPIPSDSVIEYINNALKAQGASYVGIHVRQGAKFGDVVRTLDELRKTDAKSVSVSMAELPVGRDP